MFKWIVSLFKSTNKANTKKHKAIDEEVHSLDECLTLKEIVPEKSTKILNNSSHNNEDLKSIKKYEVINYEGELKEQNLKWSSNYTYLFSNEPIQGYEVFKESRIVGCYYRKENIDEIINTFRIMDVFKFNLIIENDIYNEYDSNAKKISLIYLFDNQIRKMHLGYVDRETSLELSNYSDIKVCLSKIENIDYQDTHMLIYLKSEEVKELNERRKKIAEENKRIENERKIKEANAKIAYEMNQLAIALEEAGNLEEAIEKYKESIKLGFNGSRPFDRLNVFYRKNKDYESEIENCKKAIKIFEENNLSSTKLKSYRERLQRAIELNQKHKDSEAKKAAKVKKNITISKNISETANCHNPTDNFESIRICTICNKTKPIEDFEKNGKKTDGSTKYKHQCKSCRNKRKRKNDE